LMGTTHSRYSLDLNKKRGEKEIEEKKEEAGHIQLRFSFQEKNKE